jgi:cell division septal protein FtsQ
LPSALEVKVKNRIPLAQIYLGQYYPLDQEGFVLPFPSNFRQNELPSIRGLQPERIEIGKKNVNPQLSLGLKIVKLLKEQFEQDYINRIEIDLSDLKNIILTLPEGIDVKLGRGNFKEKLLRLNLVLKDIKRRKINPAVIDLRFQKAILVPRD